MKTIRRPLYSEHGRKSNILIFVSKQQNSLKCNQFIQEDLSNGIFGLVSHSVIEGQKRWWNCHRSRAEITPVMEEQNSKGTRENLDRICLDKVFYVLKESLMISNSGCGKQFLHLCAGFCCHEHDPANILGLTSHHDQHCRSSCSVGNSGTDVSVRVIRSGSAAEHLCECVCEERREEKWGKERLESKIIPQSHCLCLVIKEHKHLSPQR